MSTTAAGKLVNKPCFLEHNELKFIIMDAPSDQNLPLYIEVALSIHVWLRTDCRRAGPEEEKRHQLMPML